MEGEGQAGARGAEEDGGGGAKPGRAARGRRGAGLSAAESPGAGAAAASSLPAPQPGQRRCRAPSPSNRAGPAAAGARLLAPARALPQAAHAPAGPLAPGAGAGPARSPCPARRALCACRGRGSGRGARGVRTCAASCRSGHARELRRAALGRLCTCERCRSVCPLVTGVLAVDGTGRHVTGCAGRSRSEAEREGRSGSVCAGAALIQPRERRWLGSADERQCWWKRRACPAWQNTDVTVSGKAAVNRGRRSLLSKTIRKASSVGSDLQ
ncbi:hypothetical protein Q9966_001305 [Columba livia]|nr:hypothetical protein Q9966_001305 [Columba livia]